MSCARNEKKSLLRAHNKNNLSQRKDVLASLIFDRSQGVNGKSAGCRLSLAKAKATGASCLQRGGSGGRESKATAKAGERYCELPTYSVSIQNYYIQKKT